MAITSLVRDYGVTPCIVRMLTTDNLATITTAGYLDTQTIAFNKINGGAFQWVSTDLVLADYSNGQAFFTLSSDFSSLVDFFEPGGGTVTSVAMTVPGFLSIAGSPITTSGTLAVSYSGTALPVLNGGTGLTSTANNGVFIAGNTGTPAWLANSGTPGFVLTANSGAPPSWQSVTAEGAITTIDGDSGSITASAGVVTINGGTTGLTTSGNSHTLSLTGILALANGGTNADLTASAGAVSYSTSTAMAFSAVGSSGQLFQSSGTTAPGWTTSTYPATNAVSTLLYASSANVMAALTTVDSASLVTDGSGVPAWQALGAGQILVGTTAGAPAATAINSGAGILVANGSGSITVSATGGGIGWVSQASTPVTAAINTAYVVTDASTVTFTLPVTAALGSVVRIAGHGAGGWVLSPGAGQTILCNGTSASTSITSGEAGDCIEVVCTVANTTWNTLSYVTLAGFTIS